MINTCTFSYWVYRLISHSCFLLLPISVGTQRVSYFNTYWLHLHETVTDISVPQRIPNHYSDNLTFHKTNGKINMKSVLGTHGLQRMDSNVYGDHLTFPVAPPLWQNVILFPLPSQQVFLDFSDSAFRGRCKIWIWCTSTMEYSVGCNSSALMLTCHGESLPPSASKWLLGETRLVTPLWGSGYTVPLLMHDKLSW